jgi:hypothetical protein
MQDNQDKERCMDVVLITREYKKGIAVGASFPQQSGTKVGPPPFQIPVKLVPGLFAGGKAAGL